MYYSNIIITKFRLFFFQDENEIPSSSELPVATPVEEVELDLAQRILEADTLCGAIGFEDNPPLPNEDDVEAENNFLWAPQIPPTSSAVAVVAKSKSKQRRDSVVQKMSVRRSSRFFQQHHQVNVDEDDDDATKDVVVGSVFQEVDVQVKKKRSNSVDLTKPDSKKSSLPKSDSPKSDLTKSSLKKVEPRDQRLSSPMATTTTTKQKRRSSSSKILSSVENIS